MRVGPVLFLAMLAASPLPLAAQRQASLGLGTGVVRYAGGSSFSALTASPAAQRVTTFTYLGVGGSISLLDHGVWATQGRADLWTVLSPQERGLRAAVSATLAATTRSDGDAAGSASLLLEAVHSDLAIGAGVVTGMIERVPGVIAFRLRARGWRQWTRLPAQLSLSLEATHFLGAWYADVAGGVSVDRARLVASLWAMGRLSRTYGSTGAASASVQYFLTPTIALEASGGNYLRDPFQGLPRAGFLAGGVRLYSARRALTPPRAAPPPVLKPLIAEYRGDTAIVRFRMPGAGAVAIAGNWNGWTPAPLGSVGDDVWEAALRLPPGIYYFNLVVDGNEWVVPGGVATIPDGMGGLLAVLNVP